MTNYEDVADFVSWLVERPEYERAIVTRRRERGTRRLTAWWAGDDGDDLRRLRDEAHRRGIELVVEPARYTPRALEAAAHAIFGATDALVDVGFELHGVSTAPHPEGLVIVGADASRPDSRDDEPLAAELVSAVRELVASLHGIRGTFLVDDIRVQPGRIHLFH